MEGHAIEFLEQIVREFDVGLVDLVDQQHGELGRGEGLPQFALADVIADVVDALFAELAVAQACDRVIRSEEHTSELQSLMHISYAVFCLKKKKKYKRHTTTTDILLAHQLMSREQKSKISQKKTT